jgi:hypothetical protein
MLKSNLMASGAVSNCERVALTDTEVPGVGITSKIDPADVFGGTPHADAVTEPIVTRSPRGNPKKAILFGIFIPL